MKATEVAFKYEEITLEERVVAVLKHPSATQRVNVIGSLLFCGCKELKHPPAGVVKIHMMLARLGWYYSDLCLYSGFFG